jgi:AraC family transcriptional regulator, glycine betaine-responsive activator
MAEITDRNIQRFGFLLLPNFALMSYASATEPLRAANLLAGVCLYEAVPLSLGGVAVTSSGGVDIACKDVAVYGTELHTIFVCAGGHPSDWARGDALHGILRRLSRIGVRIGGISSGAFVLAAAGLLDNRDFTIHWEHAPALREAFPRLSPRHARYVLDGDRITCGGGVAPLDMMHALISERMGAHFARRVSDWYLHTAIADPADPQRGSAAERFGTRHPALLLALEKMEATIEQPLDRPAMARFVGLSERHLDRLFTGELKCGFLEKYRQIRLDHARRLLEQSPLTISEIAAATGFSSASHFSTAFRSHFLKTPKQWRQSAL